jgi:hypothetical protein
MHFPDDDVINVEKNNTVNNIYDKYMYERKLML